VSTFIVGAAGSGKTTELVRRAREAAQCGPVLVTASNAASLEVLRNRLSGSAASLLSLEQIALTVLGDGKENEIVDDVSAALLFYKSAEPLLSLEWSELLEAQVDPEVSGLRMPQRFLDAAFRLFCKLRDSRISPEQFLQTALRGAASFYGQPPNLAQPELLYYTKDSYRDSLNVDPNELQRQYRREVDLAHILARLYRSYLDHPVRAGCLTSRDAVAEAVNASQSDAELGRTFRQCYPLAFIDDVQVLTLAELQLLQALYGESLEGVTAAGDRQSAISTFRGARPENVFAVEAERTECIQQRRSPFAIDAACRHLLGESASTIRSSDSEIALTLFRATTRRAEARCIADHVAGLLAKGSSHDRIALLFRSVAQVQLYRDALLDRDVPVQVAGDLNVFSEPEAVDALAILWFLYDPFRHDYLLRVLSGAALALADSTLQTLCAEPPDAQVPLLELPEGDAALDRASRWDPIHTVRLGWSVIRGDQDARLSAVARERLEALRVKRLGWLEAMQRLELPQLIRNVWSEGLAQRGAAGSARAEYQQLTLQRLYDRAVRFAREHPEGSLGGFLSYAEERMESELESCEIAQPADVVRLLSLDSARGHEFDHVVIPRARAGAFPRWYVPDTFMYSPSLGMVAKENVGDARASRTAKFTYYMFRTKAREAYNREERRAFVYALRRARRTALVTACERPTRGVAAPEFLQELQAAKLPGAIDLTDRWSTGQAVTG